MDHNRRKETKFRSVSNEKHATEEDFETVIQCEIDSSSMTNVDFL
jgi:hypothetical protein